MARFWGRPAAEYQRRWGITEQAACCLQEQEDSSESRGVAEMEVTRAHEREIEHHPAFADAGAGSAVTAATDGEGHPFVARVLRSMLCFLR